MSNRSWRNRAGKAPRGDWFEGKIEGSVTDIQAFKDTEKMSTTASPASGHQILVQPSGRNFTATTGETILGAAIRSGIGLPYGCKDGACGSCKCKKLSGTVQLGEHQAKALSAQELADGFILTCCAQAQSDVVLLSNQVTDESAYPVKKMPARVMQLERKSVDVVLLRLQLPANDVFRYHAGQYLEFILQGGARRSYSMANAPQDAGGSGGGVELHIRHMPGGLFTDHVFGAMKDKEIVRVEGPFGSFFLREDSDKPMIFLASGTGFAPLKALLEYVHFKGIIRPITIYWGGRRPADLYLHDWLQAEVAKHAQWRYVPVVSDANADDQWAGRSGFVHRAVLEDFPDLSGHQVYACGAPIVVDSARRDFSALAQLPEDEFFADAFTSERDKHQE